MATGRMPRVNEAVREVLSETITNELKDPRVGFVTVTAVKTSPDLRQATVYVSVLGDAEAREASLEGLRRAHGFLQSRVATLRLKSTPTLAFEYDHSIDHGMRITELLDDADPARRAEGLADADPGRRTEWLEDAGPHRRAGGEMDR